MNIEDLKLGSKQKAILKALHQHGSWSKYGSGWVWDTPGGTQKVMDILVAKGLARIEKDGKEWLGHKVDVYYPT